MLRLHEQAIRVDHTSVGRMVMEIEIDRVMRAQLIDELLATLEREALLPEVVLLRLHRQFYG
jgi:hypothetical protein